LDSSDIGTYSEVAGGEPQQVGTPVTSDSRDFVEYCGIKVWYVRTLAGDYTCYVSKYKELLEVVERGRQ
jgi:hypothetical protein